MPASETLGPFLSRNWIGSVDSYDNADIVTVSYTHLTLPTT